MPTYNTSGLTSWSMTETQIIHRAGRIVGAIGSSDSMNSNEYVDARMALNGVISGLINEGSTIFKREWITQSFNSLSKVEGTDGHHYYCIKPHTSTTDNKPVTGTEFETYWASGESTDVQWISDSTYTSSNQFTLTNDIILVEKMFVRDGEYDYNVEKISLENFFTLGSKTSFTTTIPTKFAIENSLSNTTIHLYPVPIVDSTTKIHLLITRRFYESNNTSQQLDLPSEAMEMIVYLLASRLSDEYHISLDERGYLRNRAEELKMKFQGNQSRDLSSSFVSPCYDYRG